MSFHLPYYIVIINIITIYLISGIIFSLVLSESSHTCWILSQ